MKNEIVDELIASIKYWQENDKEFDEGMVNTDYFIGKLKALKSNPDSGSKPLDGVKFDLVKTITAIYADHLVIEDDTACIDKWGAEKEVEVLLRPYLSEGGHNE
jgi:hypothetical protein